MFLGMEEDIFNEFGSEDGSGDLKAQSVPGCSNYRLQSRIVDAVSEDEDVENVIYREKYKKIKKVAKGLIFENASLCDEVAQLQEKIVIAKEERRFLLRKLLSFEALKEKEGSGVNLLPPSGGKVLLAEGSDSQSKKKTSAKKRTQKNSDEPPRPRSKKKKPPAEKRFVQPIPLDCAGRPIFPIMLGALTVHSLGVIIYDRTSFHDENNIFPVGYCSSRTYISLKNPLQLCLYTCTIMDSSFGPRFEITPEDNPDHPIVGASLNECHGILLNAINVLCGRELVCSEGQGAKFFGLSHPIIQNLIQSCAGARKCTNYRWVQFEVCRQKDDENKNYMLESDPTVNYEIVQRMMLENS